MVLLTDLNTSALEEGLLPVLPQLSARHQVIVAAVADPKVGALAARRADTAQVYDAAAAERAITDRRAVLGSSTTSDSAAEALLLLFQAGTAVLALAGAFLAVRGLQTRIEEYR